jgi:putative membrane protein
MAKPSTGSSTDAPPGKEQVVLANERTFLAWIRTGLALVVTGLAIVTFEVPMDESLRRIAAILFIVLGMAAAAQAWVGWKATDHAVRASQELPAPALRVYLAAGVIAVVVFVIVGLILG